MAWNGSGSMSRQPLRKPQKREKTHSKVLLIGICCGMAIAGAVCYLLFVGTATDETPRTTKPHRSEIPVPERLYTNKTAEAEAPVIVKKTVDSGMRKKLAKMTPEERYEYDLNRLEKVPLDLTPTTNKPFRTSVELSLARIFMTEPGMPPPPPINQMIPIQDEAHLAQILIADNPILKEDDDETAEAKQMVELAKKELRDYIKNGGDTESFIQFYYSKLQDAFNERRNCMSEVVRVAKEDPSIAQEFYETINKRLEDKGIKPIAFPEKAMQRLGLEETK